MLEVYYIPCRRCAIFVKLSPRIIAAIGYMMYDRDTACFGEEEKTNANNFELHPRLIFSHLWSHWVLRSTVQQAAVVSLLYVDGIDWNKSCTLAATRWGGTTAIRPGVFIFHPLRFSFFLCYGSILFFASLLLLRLPIICFLFFCLVIYFLLFSSFHFSFFFRFVSFRVLKLSFFSHLCIGYVVKYVGSASPAQWHCIVLLVLVLLSTWYNETPLPYEWIII